ARVNRIANTPPAALTEGRRVISVRSPAGGSRSRKAPRATRDTAPHSPSSTRVREHMGRDTHDRMANAIRALAMDAVEAAKSGHPGLPMGAADIATVLFTRFLKFDPADPQWPDRDRFVLSAGHGSMLLYAALHLLGYPDMTI